MADGRVSWAGDRGTVNHLVEIAEHGLREHESRVLLPCAEDRHWGLSAGVERLVDACEAEHLDEAQRVRQDNLDYLSG